MTMFQTVASLMRCHLLLSSADYLLVSTQIRPDTRSKKRSKLFDSLMLFLKDFYGEKLILHKIRRLRKKHTITLCTVGKYEQQRLWWIFGYCADAFAARICDKYHCYMTRENPVSWLAQFVFINLYVYLETGLTGPQVNIAWKQARTSFQKLIFLTLLQYYPLDS